jgi:alkylation response protein AidB-like acyl-CoA dehydrogenase
VLLESVCEEDSSLGGILYTTSAAIEILLADGQEHIPAGFFEGKAPSELMIAMPVFMNPADADILPQAEKTENGYVLNGDLEYLTLGGIAEKAVVPARISGASSVYSFFLVDLKSETVKKTPPVLSLGLRACPSADMIFIKTPALLIGEEGKGQKYFKAMSGKMNAASAAMSLGIMKGSFKEAFEYAKKRKQGGQEIIRWTELKMILSNMAIQIKVADLMVSQALTLLEQNADGWESYTQAAAIHVQSLACDLTTDGVQAMGGVGYMKDFGQEKRFRDAKQVQALLGASQVKRIRFIDEML